MPGLGTLAPSRTGRMAGVWTIPVAADAQPALGANGRRSHGGDQSRIRAPRKGERDDRPVVSRRTRDE